MTRVLPKKFFEKPALAVARGLLGKFLVRRLRGKNVAIMITEVEAYVGPQDKASHASRGLTPRTKIMFGEAGRFYVYFTYGMHWLVNIVTGREGYPAAVLIRAGHAENGKNIEGPARLTKFFKIDRKLNGKTASRRTDLWFEDRDVKIKSSQIKRGKRVGVDYAGTWAKRLYNFKIKPTITSQKHGN